MQFQFVLFFLTSAATADQPWTNLKTTFGLPGGVSFHAQPRTQVEAIEAGLSPISSDNVCAGKHLGFAYADPDEPSLVLLYDEAGYIAGVQSTLLKIAVDTNFFDITNMPAYTEGTFFDQEAWFTTAYFVDPEVICNGGRTEQQWNEQGTGDRLWVQVGETPDNFRKIPLTDATAEENGFYKHKCFPGMGTHWIEFNYDLDQDCNSVFPVQILYDHGVLTGFVWQHNAFLPGTRWEHPNELAINGIVQDPPQCMLDMVEKPGLSTMHHYFFEYPWLTQCIF